MNTVWSFCCLSDFISEMCLGEPCLTQLDFSLIYDLLGSVVHSPLTVINFLTTGSELESVFIVYPIAIASEWLSATREEIVWWNILVCLLKDSCKNHEWNYHGNCWGFWHLGWGDRIGTNCVLLFPTLRTFNVLLAKLAVIPVSMRDSLFDLLWRCVVMECIQSK